MENNFLPSKQFTNRVIVIILIVISIISIYKIINLIKNKSNKDSAVKLINVIQKVQDDGNNNGIPDWEERLWGLDPNKNGKENKEFILAKRKAINPNADLTENNESVSENDTLSREFFSVLMSLQQTGDLDEQSMNAIADTISQKIEAEPIPDIYTDKMLKLVTDTPDNTSKYMNEIQTLIKKYENDDMGSELSLIIQSITYDDPQVLIPVGSIATSYRNFGQELIKIPVPEMLAVFHLNIANSYEKNAKSIEGLTKISSDPLVGMKSIINYKKYNEILGTQLELFFNIFQEETMI